MAVVCDRFYDHVNINMNVTKLLESLTQAVSARGALRKYYNPLESKKEIGIVQYSSLKLEKAIIKRLHR